VGRVGLNYCRKQIMVTYGVYSTIAIIDYIQNEYTRSMSDVGLIDCG
jgi:hypothetical protein